MQELQLEGCKTVLSPLLTSVSTDSNSAAAMASKYPSWLPDASNLVLTCFKIVKYFTHLQAVGERSGHRHSSVPAGYPFHSSWCGKRLSRQRQQADPAMSLTHTCCDGGLLILLKLALRPKAWLLSNQNATQIVKYSWQCHFIRVVAVPNSTSLPHISDSSGMAHLDLAQLDKNEYLLENCIERLGAELPPGSTWNEVGVLSLTECFWASVMGKGNVYLLEGRI